MRKKIKVLNVVTTIQDGGMEMLIYRIYKGLDKNIFELHIYSLIQSPENFLVKNFKESGVNVHFFGFINKNIRFGDVFKNFIEFWKLWFYIFKNRFDVINSHDFFSATITRFAVIMCAFVFTRPKRNYVTLHNLFSWLKPIHRRINRLLARFTDRIICVSKSVYLYSKENDKIDDEKYTVVYNAIDYNEFYRDDKARFEKRKLLNIGEKELLLGNVGTFSVRKGQIYLLEAFRKLKQYMPNVKLAIVAGNRNHEKAIEKEVKDFIAENDLSSSVMLLDTIKDVNSLYNSFDVFIMSSITEGFSLASLEAMLTERICIFSDIGPFKELVEDSVNGFLFESKNSESLFAKMDYVTKNFDKLKEIAVSARKSVVERFCFEKMIKTYSELYNVNV